MKTTVRIIPDPVRYMQLTRWSFLSVTPILIYLLFFSGNLDNLFRLIFLVFCIGIAIIGYRKQKEMIALRNLKKLHLSENEISMEEKNVTSAVWTRDMIQHIVWNIDDVNPMQGSFAKIWKQLIGKSTLDTIEITDMNGGKYHFFLEFESDFQKKRSIKILLDIQNNTLQLKTHEISEHS
jgi:predicted membrane protein